ncbi:acyltransferase [Conexibacter sp. SYSU D00693]|uniref:acyltransferase n=1 Tax=Conexibacter sp. SYSU D00693 TaxID=2812560 RepID=UPI001F11EC42|nr:acyltransferase [Conexibacter sp. SYSU D00693]
MPSPVTALRNAIFARHMRRQVHPENFGAFGEGTWVSPPVSIDGPHNVYLGSYVTILQNGRISCPDQHLGVSYSPKLVIGDRTHIGRDVTIACCGSIEIGSDVYASDRLLFADTYHGYEDPDVPIRDQPMVEPQPVKIGDKTNIGLGAMVLPGVTIGVNCVIGAGAVVVSDVPDNAVVVGNPGRIVRHFDHAQRVWKPGAPEGFR